jgi:peptidylprolyl isomerase
MSQIQAGDSVRVHYEGRFEDGEVFDSSEGREPLEFEAGSSQLIPGFSNAVIGMAVGDSKTVTLPPAEAYGDHDPERIQRADLEVLPEGVKVGDRLQAQSGEHQIVVEVTEIGWCSIFRSLGSPIDAPIRDAHSTPISIPRTRLR